MQLESGHLYHIYNQGNNKQQIFFNRENYLFFLKKVRNYILPHADIFAWCLMPNHFHLMIFVNNVDVKLGNSKDFTKQNNEKVRTLNNSIGIMLRSYTDAINKQEERSGALFRRNTKAECIDCTGLIPSFIKENGINKINISIPKNQYPQVCFEYIHQNPVKAGLTVSSEQWEFSSAIDYKNMRSGNLINKDRAHLYLDF